MRQSQLNLFFGILIGIYIHRYLQLIVMHNETSDLMAKMMDNKISAPPMQKDIVADIAPRKQQSTILPKRLITVFGTESSGSTFLATTLAIATGTFPKNGTYVMTPSDRYNNSGRIIVERVVAKRARSKDGEVEIQHLSLPWGFWGSKKLNCEMAAKTMAVEAFVPEPCFRFDYESTWPHRLEVKAPAGCREEAHISGSTPDILWGKRNNNTNRTKSWTCGTYNCGKDKNDGYALYPRRFFVNITSHIEWYMQRGVDVTAVLSVRDTSISRAGKQMMHCPNEDVGMLDEKRAISIMNEALSKYGRRGRLLEEDRISHHNKLNEERVIAVSYEALMGLKGPYLYNIYNTLGINSTYVPEFKDGNEKYVEQPKPI